ncbi:MAG TPA: hypothetical protein VJ552_11495 [Sediminibacterium sp.]|nr:hypothetical protein [Sediminibacterium sp.]
MDLLPHIYIIVFILLLLAGRLVAPSLKPYTVNVLGTLNVLLWFYALYNIRRFIGLIQLIRSIRGGESLEMPLISWTDSFVLIQAGRILLPFLMLMPSMRNSWWYSGVIWLFLLWSSSFSFNGWQQLFSDIACSGSLFTTTYALLWLLKKHPSQKSIR